MNTTITQGGFGRQIQNANQRIKLNTTVIKKKRIDILDSNTISLIIGHQINTNSALSQSIR